MKDFEYVRFCLKISDFLRLVNGEKDSFSQRLRLEWIKRAGEELRFNPYHDPRNGRFTTGGNVYVDFSGESGIIKEKSNKPITQITDKSIEHVPSLKIQGYSDEQSKFIQQQHKELLTYARDINKDNEVAFVFRKNLSDRKEFLGTDDKLDFGTSLTGMGDDIFVMHNHPRNSSYSDRDVRFLLEYDNVKALSIVKNNGGVEVLIKTKDFNLNEAKVALKRAYKKYVKNNTNIEIDKAIAEFLKKYREGLEWIKK